jgi:hypothetical protein
MSIPKVLGIVGCQVLEDEMAYVVASDHEVRHILVIDGTEQKTLASKIQKLAPNKNVKCFEECYDLREFQMPSGAEFTVIMWVKPIGLHQSPPLLREEVMKAIISMEVHAQSVLIFYGECGSAFRNLEKLSQEARVPITILKDKDGSPIDDCYGTEIGGKEEYRQFLVNQRGPAYVLNTMWAANWRRFMQEIQMLRDPNDLEETKEVFKYMDYQSIIGLNTGLGDQVEFERQLDEFASIFELRKENHRCTLQVVDNSYNDAKALLFRPS